MNRHNAVPHILSASDWKLQAITDNLYSYGLPFKQLFLPRSLYYPVWVFFHKFVFRFDQLYCDAFSVSDSVSLDQTWDRTPSKAPVLSFIHITQYWLVPGTDLSAFSTGRKGLSFSNSSYLSNDISSVSLVVWHLLLLDTIWHLVSQVQNMRAAIASWQTFYQNDV